MEVILKKILGFVALACLTLLALTGCAKTEMNLKNNLIEERNNLFVASDNLYNVTFSTGTREENYDFDGVVNEMVDFGIISISRNDNKPLANDKYSYTLNINGENHIGFLTKSEVDNTYSTDIGIQANNNDEINVIISFTGYTFEQPMTNVSNDFKVDKDAALKLATNELKTNLKNTHQDNAKYEVVMKILKDYSSGELKNYYWYIGVVSTNGNVFGVLIDTNTGAIVAKKV